MYDYTFKINGIELGHLVRLHTQESGQISGEFKTSKFYFVVTLDPTTNKIMIYRWEKANGLLLSPYLDKTNEFIMTKRRYPIAKGGKSKRKRCSRRRKVTRRRYTNRK